MNSLSKKVAAFVLFISVLSPAGTVLAEPQNDAQALVAKINSAGLPASSVTFYSTPAAKGVAIYIPQVHKNPGSQAADVSNNDAEIAQNQIYKIISFLTRQTGIKYVMTEGEMYGPVPQAKLDSLRSNLHKLEQNKNSQEARILEREVILKGAAHKLKAEGENFALYGAENKDTYEKSAKIVRNYVATRSKDSARQIQAVVVDQRNKETAENFAKGLTAEKTEVGILQFGAGHKKGLVAELQSQGLSVIVITPNEVSAGKKENVTNKKVAAENSKLSAQKLSLSRSRILELLASRRKKIATLDTWHSKSLPLRIEQLLQYKQISQRSALGI